jgi:thiol-disulfide isomerase/thioredoxin
MLPPEARLELVHPEFIPPKNWDSLGQEERQRLRREFEETDTYRRYASSITRIAAKTAPDGSFRAEDVPKGDYLVHLEVQAPTPGEPNHYRWVATGGVAVSVGKVSGGRSDDVVDVGTITLKEHNYRQVGEIAPALDALMFDGKRLKLADYRGKFVLLDFWAVWCGPCIAEMKHLEELQQKFGPDGRFVVISVSVDDRIDEPRRFLEDRKLPWPQAWAGRSSESSAWPTFGIGPLPSVWLIDPEGKIIVKEIYGDDIDKAIVKALTIKSSR